MANHPHNSLFDLHTMPKQAPDLVCDDLPASAQRQSPLGLPSLGELEVVRHFTRLSQKNFSIDTHFYPLGSCTMKYNSRGVHRAASQLGFAKLHPLLPEFAIQGFLSCLYQLQEWLAEITGMAAVALSPMAGSQGEFAGIAMIRAFHEARGEKRTEMLVPDAAHGTNPASAVMCGYRVVEVPTQSNGDIDLDALSRLTGPQTAGIMLTNPSTLGVFERNIRKVAECIHQAGGLLYYDGANLNAIAGKVRPGDMGFDVMHMNLHKTFATPHGGGGPGSGPIACAQRLVPFLPTPRVAKENNAYRWITARDCPSSIGSLSTFMGNAAILLRAYAYLLMLGGKGVSKVADYATLNANYLLKKLTRAGFKPALPSRLASHEFLITLSELAKNHGVTARDFAKRLLDHGMHAPTTYFPLLVPECFLIEPTETESRKTLDSFVNAMIQVRDEAVANPETVRQAPHTLPVSRLDDTKAARELDICHPACRRQVHTPDNHTKT